MTFEEEIERYMWESECDFDKDKIKEILDKYNSTLDTTDIGWISKVVDEIQYSEPSAVAIELILIVKEIKATCQDCQYKPAPNHNYPEVCISCSRFYGDMYTK